MTVNNFNWFLHTMLFIHTQHVISKQEEKTGLDMDLDSDEEDVGIEIDRDD